MSKTVIAALYKFVALPDFKALRQPLFEYCEQRGINGTVAGPREAIDSLLGYLKSDPRLVDIDHKESFEASQPFYRLKVKLKKEIVTMGVEDIDPNTCAGTYVEPEDWNALIQSPDVTVIDTRNHYEYDIGTFEHAINPQTETFRELPEYVAANLDPTKHKRVAMFCTGGIRCEKSTAYLKQQGFDEVYHLKGGILKYLEAVPEAESLWRGECFVFDNRVAVNHDLEKGQYDLCHGCRYPITEEDKRSDVYVEGVACPKCHDTLTDEQRARFSERQKQMALAKVRNTVHLGAPPTPRQVSTKTQKD